MKRQFDIVIPPGKKKERIDVYLTSHVENATRSKVQQAIRNGEVLVNGKLVKVSYTVAPGDAVSIELSQPEPPEVLPEKIPLDIVYEAVSYTHLRAHETRHDLVCRLLLEKKKKKTK